MNKIKYIFKSAIVCALSFFMVKVSSAQRVLSTDLKDSLAIIEARSMRDSLGLNNSQFQQLVIENRSFFYTLDSLNQSDERGSEHHKSRRESLIKSHAAGLQRILTAEQYQRYLSDIERIRAYRRSRRLLN